MQSEHIEHRTGAAGITHAYVGKSRIRVSVLARKYAAFLDEIVMERMHEAFPDLTLEQIGAAVRYWREHPEEIADDIRRDEEARESLKSAG